MMRRILPVPSVFLGLVALLPTVAPALDLAEIRARGTLRVLAGTNEQAEMFAFAGDRPGFERELIEGFVRLHRVELEVVAIPDRDDRIPALLDGRGDVLVGLVVSPGRQQLVDFSVPLLPAPHLVVTRAPHRVIRSLSELREERIGIVERSTWAAGIQALPPPTRTVLYPDRDAAMQALQNGDVTATVMSLYNYVLELRDLPNLQAGMRFGADGQSSWAVRKQDVELRKALDAYIAGAKASMVWSRLIVRYFGERALEVLGRND